MTKYQCDTVLDGASAVFVGNEQLTPRQTGSLINLMFRLKQAGITSLWCVSSADVVQRIAREFFHPRPTVRTPHLAAILVACPEEQKGESDSVVWRAVRHSRRLRRTVHIIRPDGTCEIELGH